MTWCTYITSHPSGFHYVGKSSPERIALGYMGSGVRLNCAFHWPGFEKSTWTTTIISVFDTEEEAYAHEGELCPLESLANPFRLNDTVGGRKMQRGSAHSRLLKSKRVKRKPKTKVKRRTR